MEICILSSWAYGLILTASFYLAADFIDWSWTWKSSKIETWSRRLLVGESF